MKGASSTRLIAYALLCAVVALWPDSVQAQYGAANGEWRSYGGDLGSTKYSALDQIDADDFADLRIAWRWQSADEEIDLDPVRQGGRRVAIGGLRATPLMVDGVLYLSTPLHQAVAIDAATGETLWVHNPESYLGARFRTRSPWASARVAWRTGQTGTKQESCGGPTTDFCSLSMLVPVRHAWISAWAVELI